MILHLQPIFWGSWETRATEKGKKYYLLMTHWRCLSQKRKPFIVMFLCQKLKCPQQARTVFSDGQLAGLERRWDHNQTTNCNPNYKMINRLKPDWWGIHFTGFRPSVIFQLQSGSNLPEPWLWARLRSRLGSKTGESLNLKIFCFLA